MAAEKAWTLPAWFSQQPSFSAHAAPGMTTSAASLRALGRMSWTTRRLPARNSEGISAGTQLERYPPTIQPALSFASPDAGGAPAAALPAGLAAAKSVNVLVGPPSSCITRRTPAALG